MVHYKIRALYRMYLFDGENPIPKRYGNIKDLDVANYVLDICSDTFLDFCAKCSDTAIRPVEVAVKQIKERILKEIHDEAS